MGGEFRTKGANVALGPVVSPLGRVAVGGRNWEGFSNDPYLCGSLAFETVLGIQEMGVITSTKVWYTAKLSIVPLLKAVALHWLRARNRPESWAECPRPECRGGILEHR